MEHYLSVVKECLDEGISARCHLEDITRADIYGYVVPFCQELMKLSQQHGESVRSALADLTYIVIGRDIMETIEAGYSEAGGR